MKRLSPGIGCALGAAVLFGASTPFAKLLLGEVSPLMLAGILYLGSGIGLALWLGVRARLYPDERSSALARADLPWLAGAILAGGKSEQARFSLGAKVDHKGH